MSIYENAAQLSPLAGNSGVSGEEGGDGEISSINTV